VVAQWNWRLSREFSPSRVKIHCVDGRICMYKVLEPAKHVRLYVTNCMTRDEAVRTPS
jgi:hypothetical protein